MILATPAVGQSVRGQLVDAEGQPAGVVLVRLMGAGGARVSAALSDANGRFFLRAPTPGEYRLRAERIGFEALEVGPFTVVGEGTPLGQLRLATGAVQLAPLTVEAESRCGGAGDGGPASALWDEVRKALELTTLARSEGHVGYEVQRFQRVRDSHGDLVGSNQSRDIGVGEAPFVSLSAGEFLAHGFIQKDSAGRPTYYGPDAPVIGSEEFRRTHCLRLLVQRDTSVVEIEFAPLPGRSLADIRGRALVDRRTKELRSIDFAYTGEDAPGSTGAGGSIVFAKVPPGYWIVREWVLRAPAVLGWAAPDQRKRDPSITQVPILGSTEAGGEVVRTFDAHLRAAGAAASSEVTGSVFDRSRALPVAGARVFLNGTSASAVTDSLGRFDLAADTVGPVTLSFSYPRLDSLGMVPVARTLALRRGDVVTAELVVPAVHLPRPARDSVSARVWSDSARARLARRIPHPPVVNGVRVVYLPSNAEIDAREALERALDADSALAPAALELSRLALAIMDGSSVQKAERALRGVVRAGGATPAVWLALADVDLLLHAPASALGDARAALDEGADTAAAFHRLGVALMLQDSSTPGPGARVYLDGLARLSDGALPLFAQDVLPLLREGGLAAWDSLATLPARAEWLQRFWRDRAAETGLTPAELIAVQQRRRLEALAAYRRVGSYGAPPIDALSYAPDPRIQGPFDDRGLVYLRYGAPDVVISTSSDRLSPNQAWWYRRLQPQAVLQFVKFQSNDDYRLTADPFASIPGSADPAKRVAGMLVDPIASTTLVDLLQRMSEADPAYGPLLADLVTIRTRMRAPDIGTGQAASPAALARQLAVDAQAFQDVTIRANRMRTTSEQRLNSLLLRSDVTPVFTRALPVTFDLLSFRGHGAGSEMTLSFAIRGSALRSEATAGGYVYRPRLSLVLRDSASGQIFSVDSTLTLRSPRLLGPGDALNGFLKLDLPRAVSGSFHLNARDAAAPAAGQAFEGAMAASDLGAPGLRLSAVAIAHPDENGRWSRGDVALQLLPSGSVPRGQPFRLYYEIYGLEPATTYQTEIAVDPESGAGLTGFFRRAGRVRISFSSEATPSAPLTGVPQLRVVQTGLRPGQYRLRVTVTERASGHRATVERTFRVAE